VTKTNHKPQQTPHFSPLLVVVNDYRQQQLRNTGLRDPSTKLNVPVQDLPSRLEHGAAPPANSPSVACLHFCLSLLLHGKKTNIV